MSNEILPGKLRANHAVSEESPIVVEKKKEQKKRARGLLMFIMALGIGAVAVGSITLPAPVAFYGYVGSPGSIDDSGNTDDGEAVLPTALAASVTATDGNGVVIEDKGLTKSGEMTITDYSDNSYSTELRCSIDSLPAYCSGSPVTISGLPPGKHTFIMANSVDDETTAHSFSWEISE